MSTELLDGMGPHTSGPQQQQTQQQLKNQQHFAGEKDDVLSVFTKIAMHTAQRFKICGCPIDKSCRCILPAKL